VNDIGDLKLVERFGYRFRVKDIALYKAVIGGSLNILEILKVTRIGQLVKIDNGIFRVALNEKAYNMRPYESGPAGDHYIFLHKLLTD
jgi:hypothetical protein